MKKNGRENTVRSKSSPDSRESLPTRTERMMGANHSSVRWFDGITRMGRIKGSMKKRAWIRQGDALPVTPVGFPGCQVIYYVLVPQAPGGIAAEKPLYLRSMEGPPANRY